MLDYFDKTRLFIDQKLDEYLSLKQPNLEGLYESIQYTLFSGGKRIRPLFCLIVGDLFNLSQDRLAPLACAIEMIHTSSLIMDDLPFMDNARVRRGKPANHLVYGHDVASLASIGLLMKAYDLILHDPQLSDDKKVTVLSKLTHTVGINGMVGGQFVDLKNAHDAVDFSTLEYVHIHKTASLFITSAETTALIGNPSKKEINAITSYAENFGFAFQLMVDLLDAHEKPNRIPSCGIEGSKELVKKHSDAALAAIDLFDGRNKKLLALSQLLLNRTA